MAIIILNTIYATSHNYNGTLNYIYASDADIETWYSRFFQHKIFKIFLYKVIKEKVVGHIFLDNFCVKLHFVKVRRKFFIIPISKNYIFH